MMSKAKRLARILSYGIFWSRSSRQRFRAQPRGWILGVWKWIVYYSLKTVPRFHGERLVERRLSILGVPVFVRRRERNKYRIALLVDEFFGGWDTAIGGYGALARKYICRFIPDDRIQIDLLLDVNGAGKVQQKVVDETTIYRLPRHPVRRQRWLDKQGYDLFLSIEMTWPSFEILRDYETNVPLLYWIQDPRDLKIYQPRQRTVNLIRDGDWSYINDVSVWMQEIMKQRRVSFISQGESLSAIAREMYQIPESVPIQDLANPVEIDCSYQLGDPPKENSIIFLGRLEAQKRVWIVCEVAKAMPQYEFYVLGATGKGRDEAANSKVLEPYRNADGSSKIRNLHFTGHLDGDAKNFRVKTAKVLLNTSIWEGIAVSWLEALSYGTLIVSAFDRDNIVGRHGTFVGEVMGDGTDPADIKKFSDAIEYWMTHALERNSTAQKAIEFVRARHSIESFTSNMRSAILGAIQ